MFITILFFTMTIKGDKIMILKFQTSIAGRSYDILDKDDNILNSFSLQEDSSDSKMLSAFFLINNNLFQYQISKYSYSLATLSINGQVIGTMQDHPQDKFITTNYYWDIKFENRYLNAYEIGFGSKGMYFVIKENGQTIAIISAKMILSQNNTYELFIQNEHDASLVIFCAIFWSLYRRPHDISIANQVLNTVSKEIKSQMDYDFIDKIAQQENYIPNNYSNEASKIHKFGVILFVIFIIFFIIALIIKLLGGNQ